MAQRPSADTVLIVGAGPVGLTAALELARHHRSVRIIDYRLAPSSRSKAIGINARTLELLEPSGVTERLLERGRRIPRVCLRTPGRTLGQIDFSILAHRYNFMLGLPQNETSALLEQRLAEYGVHVERGIAFESIEHHGQAVVCRLSHARGTREQEFAYVLGADGARSRIRRALGIEFVGSDMPGEWSLADVRMDCPWDREAVNLLFGNDGLLFVLEFKDGLYRIASPAPGLLRRLPNGFQVHEVVWRSQFQVSHRQAESYNVGRIYLAGDAAHVHSPLGARGMNLGIEDAVVFAQRIAHGRLYQYSSVRRRAGAQVVRMVKAQTRLATGTGAGLRFVRNRLLPLALRLQGVQSRVVKKMLGLG